MNFEGINDEMSPPFLLAGWLLDPKQLYTSQHNIMELVIIGQEYLIFIMKPLVSISCFGLWIRFEWKEFSNLGYQARIRAIESEILKMVISHIIDA